MKNRSTNLKTANIKWLVMLAVFDGLMALTLAPDFLSFSTAAFLRVSAALVLPVVVLLLTSLLSHHVKAVLVYWRLTHPLPGSEAFTKHGPADMRIDMAALAKNVGKLPTDPVEQNTKWYKLYRLVVDDVAVVDAHKNYLLFRDMAALSVFLVPAMLISLWLSGAPSASLLAAACLLATQYVICAFCAANSGRRLICNVMAAHSTRKIAGAKG